MEENDQIMLEKQPKCVTIYKFVEQTEKHSPIGLKTKVWRVFPNICACMCCIPFGLMLGWPSVMYVRLLHNQSSPIPITMDQSAMIAGFLLIGHSISTFCSQNGLLFPKNGLILSAFLMTIGWSFMCVADSVYWLLGSRLTIGLGSGYGLGQLVLYLTDFHPETGTIFKQFTNIFVLSGMVFAFLLGPFVPFRLYSFIATGISVFVLFLICLLPPTPLQLLRAHQLTNLRRLLKFLKPNTLNINEEIEVIRLRAEKSDDSLGFSQILRDKHLRYAFFKFAFAVFGQQFTGVPATLVYTQFIFKDAAYPECYAIIYIVIYFIMNLVSAKCVQGLNKRNVLLLSNSLVTVILVLNIIVEYFQVTELYFRYTLVLTMIAYLVCHTFGLGTIPVSFIGTMFPANCAKCLTLFFTVYSSLLAVVLTKLFQVLYTYHSLLVAFTFFLVNSVVMFVFTVVFIPTQIETVAIK